MRLDIRLPIGLMFAVLGALLVVVGLLGGKSSVEQSQGTNVNLWWGIVMLIFGVVMFLLGRRGTSSARLAEESPEGRKIEELEQATGLEK
jgi:hypothetical protein